MHSYVTRHSPRHPDGPQFLQSTKGNEVLPTTYKRSARRRTRNAICAALCVAFAYRISDSVSGQLVPALCLAVLAYFTVGSVQNIKRQMWGIVGWIESLTELSLPAKTPITTAGKKL